MENMILKRSILVTAFLGLVLLVKSQTNNGTVTVSGEVTRPLSLTASKVAAMTHIVVTANDKDKKPHSYSGVPMQAILDSAGVTTGKQLHGEYMRKYVLVKCADGYAVLFSLAELDSSITSRPVILADSADGAPLPAKTGPFRVVVEGEKRPARNCFQVTDIIIKSAKE